MRMTNCEGQQRENGAAARAWGSSESTGQQREHGRAGAQRASPNRIHKAWFWVTGGRSSEAAARIHVSLTLARYVAGTIDRVGAALGRRARRVTGLNEGEAHT